MLRPAALALLAGLARAQAPAPSAPPAASAPPAPPPATEPAPAPPQGPATGAPKPAGADEEPRAEMRTVAGKIRALDWKEQRFTIDAADGPLTLRVDRNTMVFLEWRQGTVRDLAVGVPVRASLGAPGDLAYWVEVRRAVTPTPGKAAPPAAAAATSRAEGTDAGPGTPAGGPGSPGGPGAPPTDAPTPPPTAPAPGTPAGPGPVPGGTGGGR